MPKYPTHPSLYDRVLKISITKLVGWGYLKPNQRINTNMVWSSNGETRGEIKILVDTTENDNMFIELDYKYKDQLRHYKINIVSINSNLGKGKIYYFVCPHTQRLCRNLYSISGYFYHRRAFKGCMYECQIQSKKYRSLNSQFGSYFKSDNIYEQLHKKNFKKTYAGKPTKRYLKLTKLLELNKRREIDYNQFERQLYR
jgi:hypothetical protein